MSKPLKELMMTEYKRRFDDLTGALLIDIRGIDANDNNTLRLDLAEKGIRVTVIRNTLARKAFAGTALEAATPLLDGPSALAYGAESVVEVARELVEWARKVADLQLKGAVLDGELFSGDEGVRRLSTFPTRPEAQARVVQLIISPAGRLLGSATSPGARLLAIVKEIQDRLEEGRPIARVG